MLSKHSRKSFTKAQRVVGHHTESPLLSNQFVDDKLEGQVMVHPPAPSPSLSPLVEEDKGLTNLYRLLTEVSSVFEKDTEADLACHSRLSLILSHLEQWLLTFQMFGFRFEPNLLSCKDSLIAKVREIMWTVSTTTASVLDYFKYFNAAFISSWMPEQVVPTAPTWFLQWRERYPQHTTKVLLGGKFFVYLKKIMRGPQRLSFCVDILMSKKGMPRPSAQYVQIKEFQAYEQMTSPKKIIEEKFISVNPDDLLGFNCHPVLGDKEFTSMVGEESLNRVHTNTLVDPFATGIPDYWSHQRISAERLVTREMLEKQIDRTVRDLFRNVQPDLYTLTQIFLPSAGASYNYSRSKGGQYQIIKDMIEDLQGPSKLMRFSYKMTKLSGYVSEYYGAAGVADEIAEETLDLARFALGVDLDYHAFLSSWRKLYWKIVLLAHVETPYCEINGLSEALKVRIISKGPPLLYFVLKPFQKLMLKELQKTWNFELTGKPISEELINERFGDLKDKLFGQGCFRYHSGDYKDATNEMYSWASDQAAKSVCTMLDKNSSYTSTGFFDTFYPLISKALIGHVYLEPKGYSVYAKHNGGGLQPNDICVDGGKDEGRDCRRQERGQLMGSIVSFPILCIVNASLLWLSYEMAHGTKYKHFSTLPIWINGDDCLTAYVTQAPLFPVIWEQLGLMYGLENSIGKTYDSPDFCCINSNFFTIKRQASFETMTIRGEVHQMKRHDGVRFTFVPYVNRGIVLGLLRSEPKKDMVKREKVSRIDMRVTNYTTAMKHGEMLKIAGGMMSELAHKAHLLFMYKNRQNFEYHEGSWFLPVWAGGLGLVDINNSIDDRDITKAVAAKFVLGSRPDLRPKITMEKHWMVFDKYNQFLNKCFPLLNEYNFESYQFDETEGQCFAALVYKIILDRGLKSIFSDKAVEGKNMLKLASGLRNKIAKLLANKDQYELIRKIVREGGEDLRSEITSQEVKKSVTPIFCSQMQGSYM